MRFGFNVPLLRPELSKPMTEVYRDAVEQIECAEASGFDIVWFPEHHFTHHYCCPNPLMSAIDTARRTSRIKVGTAVIMTSAWHPLILAEQIAFADHLTDGRLEVGLGRGGSPYEYVRLGMTDSEAAERQYEALEILLGIWGADEDYAHEGKCFKFPAVYTVPRPLQSPHPPLWVAARTPDTLRFCVEHGLGIQTTTLRQPMTATYATLNTIDALVDEIGPPAPPRFSILRETLVSDSESEIMGAMGLVLRNHTRIYNQIRGRGTVRGYGTLDPLPEDAPLTAELLVERSIVGNADACVQKLKEYEATGAHEFIAHMDFGQDVKAILRSIEAFGTKVIPHFRGKTSEGRRRGRAAIDPALSAARRERLLASGQQEFGEGWRGWTVGAWLQHYERPLNEKNCHVFDLSVAPQNARADPAGVTEPTGRLMMIRDQACPECGRPVIAFFYRRNGESGTQMRAVIAERLKELNWHALHP
jgi:alkanesulfonate monooxygenase SsuD/methylene tetrahydromethanopterin reductase-like flavin-dependent oxidoreductase (luciferase family)